jgi:hypothetical protein
MKLIKCIADVAMPCCCGDYSKLDHNHFSVERARQYAAELQRTRAAFGGWTTSYAAKSPQRPSTRRSRWACFCQTGPGRYEETNRFRPALALSSTMVVR